MVLDPALAQHKHHWTKATKSNLKKPSIAEADVQDKGDSDSDDTVIEEGGYK